MQSCIKQPLSTIVLSAYKMLVIMQVCLLFIYLFICSAKGLNPGHTRQTLYQLNYIPIPSIKVF